MFLTYAHWTLNKWHLVEPSLILYGTESTRCWEHFSEVLALIDIDDMTSCTCMMQPSVVVCCFSVRCAVVNEWFSYRCLSFSLKPSGCSALTSASRYFWPVARWFVLVNPRRSAAPEMLIYQHHLTWMVCVVKRATFKVTEITFLPHSVDRFKLQ